MREELRPVEPALCGGFAPGDPAAVIQREGFVAVRLAGTSGEARLRRGWRRDGGVGNRGVNGPTPRPPGGPQRWDAGCKKSRLTPHSSMSVRWGIA